MYRKYIPKNAKLIPERAKKVFQGIIYSVWHWDQEMFDGTTETFEMLKRPDTVEVIAVIDEMIIVQEEQPFLGVFTDIPGGRHDYEIEDELQSAQRELKEETGYELSEWKLIKVFQSASKIDYFNYVFLAYGRYTQSSQKLDNGEKIKTSLIKFEDFKSMAPTLRSYKNYKDLLEKINSIDDLLNLDDLYKNK